MKRAFLKAGHLPTLVSCFLYFDMSFMVWVLLGPMAVLIAHDLHLSASQKGLMVAIPVLVGALLRVVNGVLVGPTAAAADRNHHAAGRDCRALGGLAHRHSQLQPGAFAGCRARCRGRFFAIALPMVSYWYPPSIRAWRWAWRAQAIRHRPGFAVCPHHRGNDRLGAMSWASLRCH